MAPAHRRGVRSVRGPSGAPSNGAAARPARRRPCRSPACSRGPAPPASARRLPVSPAASGAPPRGEDDEKAAPGVLEDVRRTGLDQQQGPLAYSLAVVPLAYEKFALDHLVDHRVGHERLLEPLAGLEAKE